MASASTSTPKTDVGYTDAIFQSFKVYIEGVQVPFENFSISQGIDVFPSAVLTVPPQAGLMNIARFYQPKVHIFYEDQVDKRRGIPEQQYFKLLFHGTITGVSYNKSRNESSGNISIQFMCKHRNHQLLGLMIDYAGWLENISPKQDGALSEFNPNSQNAVYEALSGIMPGDFPKQIVTQTNVQAEVPNSPSTEVDTRFLDRTLQGYFSKLQGMPGVLVNYWNQLKRAAYKTDTIQVQDVFNKLYEPLFETGIKFFERLSGHVFLESQVMAGKLTPCPSKEISLPNPIIIPPCAQLSTQSAAQTQMVLNILQNYMQSDGNLTNLYSLFTNVLDSLDYELVTLASPSETPLTETDVNLQKKYGTYSYDTSSVETIVKPKLFFYFSPSCNILYPQMYSNLQVQYDEENIPTRVIMINQEPLAKGYLGSTRFRAPESIRDAILAKIDSPNKSLEDTTTFAHGAIGLYEQGRGVNPKVYSMPPWLCYLSASLPENSQTKPPQTDPTKNTCLQNLAIGWDNRYPTKKSLNPWTQASDTSDQHRLLFSSAEFEFAHEFAATKSGTVDGPFNPYITPGYPMDILEASPQAPSFHAYCTGVTHNISSQGVSTSIMFTGAMTYEEIADYYVPFMYPSLLCYLNLATNPTIMGPTQEAITAADQFYYYTLGCKSLRPEFIYDFYKTGLPIPVDIDSAGNFIQTSGNPKMDKYGVGELNKSLTFQGNLNLAYRPIESQDKISKRFNYKFIDLTFGNYSPTVIKFDPLNTPASSSTLDTRLEIGASKYLDYSTLFGNPPP